MERKYAAFISYRHAELDSAAAKAVHTLIEQYRIPKALRKDGEKKFGIVFRDEEELSATNDLTDKIYTALDNSEHLVVICTNETLKSPWVTKETEHFLSNHPRSNVHIILAEGEPMAVFPKPLTCKVLENGDTEITEPMAVDVRAENIPAVKKKLKTQIFRLFAAMLGCPYDTLVMRQQRRKRRRIATVMSMVLAVAISFSAVLLVKNRQIDRKNQELDLANTALEEKNTELDSKNRELEEKNSEILLRESELLTADSQKAYKEGDNYSAIANAALALPTEDDPRPYYASAEAALLTALSPFDGEDGYIMENTALQQSTPVKNFRISPDGTRLATIDMYSVVTIFDTESGEALGTVQLNKDTVYYSSVNVHLLSCGSSVIAFDGSAVTAVSFETCAPLWTYTDKNAVSDFFMLSNDKETAAYIRTSVNQDDLSSKYELALISCRTGSLIKTIPFTPQDIGSDTTLYFKGSVSDGLYNGRFSDDDTRFITSYFTADENDIYTIHYVLIDIETGTSRQMCSFETDDFYFYEDVYFLYFYSDDSIIAVRENPKYNCALTAERISLTTGKLLWQLELPKNTSASSEISDRVFCFSSGNICYVILNDCLYVFDSDTGDFISTSRLSGVVADAYIVNGALVYALTDGHYSAATISNYGLNDTGISVSLGELTRMQLWNDGPSALNGGEDSSGYIAVVPSDNESSVLIRRISPIKDLFPAEYSGLNEGSAYLSTCNIYPLTDGTVAIGPYYADSTYFFKVIDPDTREIMKELPSSMLYSVSSSISFLPDSSGFIHSDKYGSISLFDTEGNETVLADTKYVMYNSGDTFFYDLSAISSSSVLTETGDVMSVLCENNTLSVWLNGKDKKEIPLPDDIVWMKQSDAKLSFFLETGCDGSIVLPDFDDDDLYVDRFAVYNALSGTLHFIENDDIHYSEGHVCFSGKASALLITDDNGTIFIYGTDGVLQNSFSLNLPPNSVFQTELIMDDEYLLVKTSDLQVNIYETASGRVIYSESNVSAAQLRISAYYDSKTGRLYLASPSTAPSSFGLCIDTQSWTTLAKIDRLVYFNETTCEIFRIATHPETHASVIFTQKIPEVSALASLAREYLGI